MISTSSAAQRPVVVAHVLKPADRGVQMVERAAIPPKYSTMTIRRARRKGDLAASKFVALIHPIAELVLRELRLLLYARAVRRVAKSANSVSTLLTLTALLT